MLCRVLDRLFQLDLHPNRPCMMMIGGVCALSAADSYDVYDILTGSSLVLNGRRQPDNGRRSRDKPVMNANDALDLIIVRGRATDGDSLARRARKNSRGAGVRNDSRSDTRTCVYGKRMWRAQRNDCDGTSGSRVQVIK